MAYMNQRYAWAKAGAQVKCVSTRYSSIYTVGGVYTLEADEDGDLMVLLSNGIWKTGESAEWELVGGPVVSGKGFAKWVRKMEDV